MKSNKNHELAHMSWFIPVFLFFCWEPLGILLGVLKVIDMRTERREQEEQAAQRREQEEQIARRREQEERMAWRREQEKQAAQRRAAAAEQAAAQPQHSAGSEGWQNGSARTFHAPIQEQPARPTQPAQPEPAKQTSAYVAQNTREQKKNLKRHRVITAVLGVLAAVALFSGIVAFADCISWLFYGWGDVLDLVLGSGLRALVQILGGVGLGTCSVRMARNLKRENLLVTIVGERDSMTVKELSTASGYDQKKVLDLLKDAVSHGLFGPTAYVDMGTRTLVVRGTPPARPAPKRKKAAAPAAAAEEDPYQATLRELRELNDAIPGEEMTAKISQLEKVSARIFDLAEQDPRKKPMLNRFMDYYLPTAKKLLKTYATLDSQGVEGTNISETKATIEHSMDLLVQAFEAQLDKLFQADALDVSGDVAALQGMMSMDGLAGPDFAAPQQASSRPE